MRNESVKQSEFRLLLLAHLEETECAEGSVIKVGAAEKYDTQREANMSMVDECH